MCFFCFFRPNEHYVFLGYSNGVLRLHKIISPKFDPKIKKPFLNWTLEDYWHIHLHDPSNGAIREIFPIDTIKGHLILTCAQDGSLLVHEIGKGYLFSEYFFAFFFEEQVIYFQKICFTIVNLK